MCAKTHSAAPSADELPVASAALLLPFSLKPMDTSCATMSASGSIAGCAGSSPPIVCADSPSSAGGKVSSPAAIPVPRSTDSTSTVSGMGTKTSSFRGVQSSAT